ncbi:FMN-binding protein [Porticoccus sp. GXU_MW_L64]
MKLIALVILSLLPCLGAAKGISASEFVSDVFSETEPTAGMLWLNGEQRRAVESVLGHRFAGLRVRYWQSGQRTAWVLDEIGKERPITIGVVVCEDAIEAVKILEFRESRGWEVRYPFFTDQFVGVRLSHKKRHRLDSSIDGITGATLSVRAVKKVATLALFFHSQLGKKHLANE